MMTKEEKKKFVEELVNLFNSHKTLGWVDFFRMPTSQYQQIKEKLRGKIKIKYVKKSLLKKALEKVNIKNVDEFLKYLPDQIGVLFTNEDPFKIFKEIKKYVVYREAKAGDIAPRDIVIKPMLTNLPPGPAISELQKVGLNVGIEKGKIAIKKEKTLVRKGEVINADVASVLQKLGIKPIEVSLNITAMLYDGIVFPRDVLDVDVNEYIKKLQSAFNNALLLSIEIAYPTKENIEFLISKAFKIAKTLGTDAVIFEPEIIKDLLVKANLIAESVKNKIGV